MNIPRKITLLRGLEDDRPTEPSMKFRLTYEGELRPSQRDPYDSQNNPLAKHKHSIRRIFHRQLKRLWATDRFLKEKRVNPSDCGFDKNPTARSSTDKMWSPDENNMIPLVDVVSESYRQFDYRFVPLVRGKWSLLCSLDILVLRNDCPGSVIQAGDIDNRIKTLIDALRRPQNQQELIGDDSKPREGEDPFFVLMEDDNQVSHFSVEADTLLDQPQPEKNDHRKAKVLITVELRPYYVTNFNLSLAGF